MTTGFKIGGFRLFGWGDAENGELGLGYEIPVDLRRSSPVQNVTLALNWKMISGGKMSSAALKNDGTLWTWGRNNRGQLGDNTVTHRSSPVQEVTGASNWVQVTTGAYHMFGIKSDGTLWGWGNNDDGQLGDNDGTTTNKSSPIQTVSGGTDWQFVNAGAYSTGAIKTDGTLWMWGYNNRGQLGDNSITHRSSPVQVSGGGTTWKEVSTDGYSGGHYHTVALKTDGTVWSWGYNEVGQLGHGNTTDLSTPTQIGANTTWKKIVAGGRHTAAIKIDGTLWCWGNNTVGQCATNDTTHRSSPVQEISANTNWTDVSAGSHQTYGTKADGTIWSWGWNNFAGLGNGTFDNKSSPIQATPSGERWKLVDAGWYHVQALKLDAIDFDDKYIRKTIFQAGNMFGWGDNTYGSLGTNDITHRSSPVQTVAGGANWKLIATGWYHTLGIKTDGRLWAWGHNLDGQLGDGGITKKSSPVAIGSLQNWKTVSGGSYHSLATKNDGTAWAWGFNTYGILGLGDQTHRSSPNQIGANTIWKTVSAGYYHSAGLKTDGTLWTWGRNHLGQLGQNDLTHRSSPAQVGALTNWKDVASGGYFTTMLRNDGTIWTAGENSRGQLGDNSSTDKSSPVQETTLGTNWIKIAAGGFLAMAIKNNGTLWTWGRNHVGQLGDNTIIHRSSPVQTVSGGTNWKLIASSDYSSFGIKTDGTLWAWGSGARGRMGDGTTVNKSSPVQIGTADDWIALTLGGGGAMRSVD
jgi:alpha-tubulin suppressor-like RCC1 family protein